MKGPILSSDKDVSNSLKIDTEDKNRHYKETIRSPDNIANDFQGTLRILTQFISQNERHYLVDK